MSRKSSPPILARVVSSDGAQEKVRTSSRSTVDDSVQSYWARLKACARASCELGTTLDASRRGSVRGRRNALSRPWIRLRDQACAPRLAEREIDGALIAMKHKQGVPEVREHGRAPVAAAKRAPQRRTPPLGLLGAAFRDFQRVSARFRSSRRSFSPKGVVTCNNGRALPL